MPKVLRKLLNIHNSLEKDYEFYEIKDKSIEEYIKEYEIKYRTSFKQIKSDKEMLKKFIRNARKETKVTIIELAEILQISKTTIGRYSKNN